MMEKTVKVNVETDGFEEATEKVEMLVDAYDGFPAQLTIKNCRDCNFYIYPSQNKTIVEGNPE